MTGVVKDAEGRPIKGASITAESPNWAATTVTTDVKGRYSFLGLRGGTLDVDGEGARLPDGAEAVDDTNDGASTRSWTSSSRPSAEPGALGPLANLDTQELQQQLAAAAELDKAGKLDEAIARYREILTRVPALTSVHLPLGALFERKGETAAAVAEYEAALKADPASVKARAALDRLAR